MEIRLINLRIKRGYGTVKCAKQLYDDEGYALDGKYEWGNPGPTHRGTYGDPPKPNIAEEGCKKKCWPEQKAALSKDTTANMLYKAAYS